MTGFVNVEVTQESAERLRVRFDASAKGIAAGARAGINAAVIELASIIKRDYLSGQSANVRTGNLRRAVFHKMESDLSGVVGVDPSAPYGQLVNDGTRPHRIESKPGGPALMFAGSGGPGHLQAKLFTHSGRLRKGASGAVVSGAAGIGAIVFRRGVNHPGTKATQFMQTALASSADRLKEIIQERINRGVQGHE